MSGSRLQITGSLILALLVTVAPVVTGAPVLINAVIGASGGSCGALNYGIQCTVGQPLAGGTADTGMALAVGFWPGFQAVVSPVPASVPDSWWLGHNYPNPFNPVTEIHFTLPADAVVRLEVYDLRGCLIRILVDAERPAGDNVAIWNGLGDDGVQVASGLYIARLESAHGVLTRKMMLTR